MKKMRAALAAWCVLAACCAEAEGAGRDAFMRQQAMDEVIRVSGQVDVLQSNLEEVAGRVAKLESGGDVRALKADVESLRADIAAVRREMQNMHAEIVKDLTKKLVEMQRQMAAQAAAAAPAQVAPAASTRRVTPTRDVQEYVVESGDTLSLIAQAFRTNVPELKRLNGLRSDRLSIGQKLLVPKNK